MRRATSRKAAPGQATAVPVFIPPPLGGLNTRDPPALVPITDAQRIGDFFPTVSGFVLRKGYTVHTTGITPTVVESLMVYTSNAGTEAMFAARGTAFYNVSSAGALGAAVVSGLTNAKWQHVNFTNSSATAYLCAFNGADSPQYWDGATWTAITGVSTPAITGVTTTTLISAAIHQRRMWLVQVSSLKLWYLPVDSVGGAAAALDLGGIAYKGGYIMAAESWTIDGGDGLDDYLVCITSEGQFIAFQGTDPSSASTWQHVGTWDIAEPIGRRCLYPYKGDVLIITNAGVASAARIMSGDTSASGMLTDKISGSYATAFSRAPTNLGWQLIYYPKADMLLLSLPLEAITGGAGIGLFPMNSVTGAWGQFQIGARCWAMFNGEPYYAWAEGALTINKFWSATTDDGAAISGSVYHGFGDLGLPGVIKKPNLLRAAMVCDSQSTTGLACMADYQFAAPQASVTIASVNGIAGWVTNSPGKKGVVVAPAFTSSSTATVYYNGCYILFEGGGLVGSALSIGN